MIQDWENSLKGNFVSILLEIFKYLLGNQPQLRGFSQPRVSCFNPHRPSPPSETSSNVGIFCSIYTNISLLQELQNTAKFQLNLKHPGIWIFILNGNTDKKSPENSEFKLKCEATISHAISAVLEYTLTFVAFARWQIIFVVIYPLLQRYAILWDNIHKLYLNQLRNFPRS